MAKYRKEIYNLFRFPKYLPTHPIYNTYFKVYSILILVLPVCISLQKKNPIYIFCPCTSNIASF